jgi:antitoxin component YwqK of YwqJK toxin-antitoxin module
MTTYCDYHTDSGIGIEEKITEKYCGDFLNERIRYIKIRAKRSQMEEISITNNGVNVSEETSFELDGGLDHIENFKNGNKKIHSRGNYENSTLKTTTVHIIFS